MAGMSMEEGLVRLEIGNQRVLATAHLCRMSELLKKFPADKINLETLKKVNQSLGLLREAFGHETG